LVKQETPPGESRAGFLVSMMRWHLLVPEQPFAPAGQYDIIARQI
jgi:hypothetical protein